MNTLVYKGVGEVKNPSYCKKILHLNILVRDTGTGKTHPLVKRNFILTLAAFGNSYCKIGLCTSIRAAYTGRSINNLLGMMF